MSPSNDPVNLGAGQLELLNERGLAVPTYDRTRLVPRIVHIGVGGFHRSHLAAYCHELATNGADWGICGIGLLDRDRAMAEALSTQDHLYTLTTRHHATAQTQVVGSIIDYVLACEDTAAAIEAIGRPVTAIVSLTVTEAGYGDNEQNHHTFDVIAAGLAERRKRGHGGVTIMSCDNMTSNGQAARRSVIEAAHRHDDTLAQWVATTCSFPNSMVDRITPATSDFDRRHLVDNYGLVDSWPVVAEPYRQWVIEDDFAAGRPDITAVGAVITEDVAPWELYKLRLLNAGHSAIAHLAALAGITHVDEALAVPDIKEFLQGFLRVESAPTLVPIPDHPPEQYVADVLERFSNNGIRDQVARLCVDGTAKAATFLMPILADQLTTGGPIQHSVLTLAAWAHYLADTPIDDQAFDASAEMVRPLARAAVREPAAFIDQQTGFPPEALHSERLETLFVQAHRAITQNGPLKAIRDLLTV